MVHCSKRFPPRRVPWNVSTLDILSTLVDLIGIDLNPYLPMDGTSLLPQLQGISGHDPISAERYGEGAYNDSSWAIEVYHVPGRPSATLQPRG